jgi:hypothetical protein
MLDGVEDQVGGHRPGGPPPRIRRQYASMTKATYTNLIQVRT